MDAQSCCSQVLVLDSPDSSHVDKILAFESVIEIIK